MPDKRLKYPSDWLKYKRIGAKISVLTAYDACFAKIAEKAGVDAILVGDSVAMLVQGHNSTTPVSLEQMLYHCKLVRRGAPNTFIIGDMPFGSYHGSENKALENGIKLFQEGGIDALKVEGAYPSLIHVIPKWIACGIPIIGHIGLQPQSFRIAGGYRRQGKTLEAAAELKKEAYSLQKAGCFALVLELVSAKLTETLTQELDIATIGIGSGNGSSGQVLVMHDMLGLAIEEAVPKHVKSYANLGETARAAIQEYCMEVKDGRFDPS